jgi:hypothetical protein
MYVLAVLCTLKLYHARHADINVKSHMAYIVLALLVGLGAGTAAFTSQFYFKLGFTVVHLIACVALAIDVYYMGHWKLGKVPFEIKYCCTTILLLLFTILLIVSLHWSDKETMVEHVNTCWKSRPLYLERLTLVVVGKVRLVLTTTTTTIGDKVKGGGGGGDPLLRNLPVSDDCCF